MRLDAYLAANGYAKSRTEAKRLIEAGAVFADGVPVNKPSLEIVSQTVEVRGEVCPFVSRGGLKLDFALDRFGIDVRGLNCIDVGASTGGFTDCLLKRGAATVVALDCGHGQLDPSLASDPRVRQMDGVNARGISPDLFDEPFDLCVTDVSFISQTLIHPNVFAILREGGMFVSLVKPQFEAGRAALNKKGVVRDVKQRKLALDRVVASAESLGFEYKGSVTSPITGGDGNIEFLTYFIRKVSTDENNCSD